MTDPTETSAGEAASEHVTDEELVASFLADKNGEFTFWLNHLRHDHRDARPINTIPRLIAAIDAATERAVKAEAERDQARAVVEQIQADRDRFKAISKRVDQQNVQLITALQIEAAEQRTRAEAAERELAELRTHAADEHGRLSQDLDNAEEVVRLRKELVELRERIGEGETEWGYGHDAYDVVPIGDRNAAQDCARAYGAYLFDRDVRYGQWREVEQ